MSIYRNIYEQLHGPIPVDETGRTYDIHHIDGNRNNNDPNNLIALTVKQHYDIHYKQGDWMACLWISHRLNMSPSDISVLASNNQKKKLEKGLHHFQDSNWQSENQKQRVRKGTHPWTNKTYHILQNEERIKSGTHNLLGSSSNQDMLSKGLHSSQKEWTCEVCGKNGKGSTNYRRWHGDNCKMKG